MATIANTRNPFGPVTAAPAAGTTTATTGSTIPDYMAGLEAYTNPNMNFAPQSATQLMADPLQATIANAPSLEKVANIISQINQQSYLSAPGRQQELANISRWQAGELDPSVYQQEASRAAQLYGGGGFGVDSPAWQAAVQRALVTNRQALQEKGAGALEEFYRGMPVTDVSKYTLSPSDYAGVLDAQRSRQLQLAELQQKGALTRAELAQKQAIQNELNQLERERLAQAKSLAQQELAFKEQQLAQNLKEAEMAAYAKNYWDPRWKGYGGNAYGSYQSGDWANTFPTGMNWIGSGYTRPPIVRG